MLKNVLSTRELLSDNSDRYDSSASLEASQQPYSQFDFSQLNTQDILSQPFTTNSQTQEGTQGRKTSLYEKWLGKSSEGKLCEYRETNLSMALKRPLVDKSNQQQISSHYLKAKSKDERDIMQQMLTSVKDLASETLQTMQEMKELHQVEITQSVQAMRVMVSSFLEEQEKKHNALLETIQDEDSKRQQLHEIEMEVAQRDGEIKQLREKLRGENDAKKLHPAILECQHQSEGIASVLKDYVSNAEARERELAAEQEAQADFRSKCMAELKNLDRVQLKSLEKGITEGVKKENKAILDKLLQLRSSMPEYDKAVEKTTHMTTQIHEEISDMKQTFQESMVNLKEEILHKQQTYESKMNHIEALIKGHMQQQTNQMKQIVRRVEEGCANNCSGSHKEQSVDKTAACQSFAQPLMQEPMQHNPNPDSQNSAIFKLPTAYRSQYVEPRLLASRPLNGNPASLHGDRGNFEESQKAPMWTRDPRTQMQHGYPGQAMWSSQSCCNVPANQANVMKRSMVTSQCEKQTYLMSSSSPSPMAIMFKRTQMQHRQMLSNRQPTGAPKTQVKNEEMSSRQYYPHQQRRERQMSSLARNYAAGFQMRASQQNSCKSPLPSERQRGKMNIPFEWDDSDSDSSSMLNPHLSMATKTYKNFPARNIFHKPSSREAPMTQRTLFRMTRLQEEEDEGGDDKGKDASDDDDENQKSSSAASSPSKSVGDLQSVCSWLEQAKTDNGTGRFLKSYMRTSELDQSRQETRRMVTRSSAKKFTTPAGEAEESLAGPPRKQKKTASGIHW